MPFFSGKRSPIGKLIAISIFVYLTVSFILNKSDIPATISKETTYITEPLRADGYPDYITALNQRASKGVTPENNAAVIFWKAMGSAKIAPKYREIFWQMLGISPIPEKGDYFVDLEPYVTSMLEGKRPNDPGALQKRIREVTDQQTAAMRRPWTRKDFFHTCRLAGNQRKTTRPDCSSIQTAAALRSLDRRRPTDCRFAGIYGHARSFAGDCPSGHAADWQQ